MVNATTPLGLLLAACARTRVRRGPRGLLLATGYRWRLPFAAAFTVGNVVLFRAGPDEALANPVLLGHEERHATQYAWCLGVPFLPLYFLAAAWSLIRTGNPGSANFLSAMRAPGRRLPAGHSGPERNEASHDGNSQIHFGHRTGTAEEVPDLLTLSLGVECRRPGVDAAYGMPPGPRPRSPRCSGSTASGIRTSPPPG